MVFDYKLLKKWYAEYRDVLSELLNGQKDIIHYILEQVYIFNACLFMIEEDRHVLSSIPFEYRDDDMIIQAVLNSKNAFSCESYSGELYHFYVSIFGARPDITIPKIVYEEIPKFCNNLKDIPDEMMTLTACMNALKTNVYDAKICLKYIKERRPEYINIDFWIEVMKLHHPEIMYEEALEYYKSHPYSPEELEMIHIAAAEHGILSAFQCIKNQTQELWNRYVLRSQGLANVPDEFKTDELLINYLKSRVNAWHGGWAEIPDEALTKDFVMKAIRHDWELFKTLNAKYKTKRVCEVAIEQSALALAYVPKKFKTQQVCNDCFKRNPNIFQHIPDECMSEEMSLRAVSLDYDNVRYVPKHYLTDRIVTEALDKYRDSFYIIKESNRTASMWLLYYEKMRNANHNMDYLYVRINNISDRNIKHEVMKEILKKGDEKLFGYTTACNSYDLLLEYARGDIA